MTNPLEPALATQVPREDRRLRWYHAKLALGLCGTCGSKPRAQRCDGSSATKCVPCLVASRHRQREANGWKPRYVSGLGRPIRHKLNAQETAL